MNTQPRILQNLGKQQIQLLQQVTTLSISHAQNRARSGYAMARKGTMKWNLHATRDTIMLQSKQQDTTLSVKPKE